MKAIAELHSPSGKDLEFLQLEAEEAISQPFTYRVLARSNNPDIDYNALVGQNVSVKLHIGEPLPDEPRYFHGVVEEVMLQDSSDREYRYLLKLRPWFWFLSQTQDCKVFQNKTVLQIIDEVLADHPMALLDNRTMASYTPWVYCVQYRESDFNFLSRLMEQEGIYYYFTHDPKDGGKHTMVIADSASSSDACVGCDALRVRRGSSGAGSHAAGQQEVWDLASARRVMPGTAVIGDYDFTRVKVLQQDRAEPGQHVLGDMEFFDYPGFYDKEDDGKHFVAAQMEEYASATQFMSGACDAPTLSCGGLIQLKGSPRAADNAECLVLSTSIRVHNEQLLAPAAGEAGIGFALSFTALPSAVSYRARRLTPKPVVQGPQTAVVVGPAGDEIYTDKYGRVKVQFHWDRYGKKDEKSSCWVRVSSPWAGKSFGFIQVPRIGQEVVVDFLEGDPDQPLITGRVYNAEQMPPWELPANATQSGVLTRSSKGGAYSNANAIRFEDKTGAEQLWIHAEKNQDIEVENDETHWVGHDRTKTIDHDETNHIKHDRTETVDNNEKITIGVDRTESVGNNEKIAIGVNRTETVGSNENIAIGVNRTETVGSNETITVGSNRSVTVGASETKTVALQRTHTVGVNETITVGAAQEVTIGALQAVTVGASQTVNVGVNRSVDVGSALSTSVGADESRSVGDGRSTTIGKDDALKVGKNLVIDAGDSVTIKTGSASITMKKDGTITIKGKDITIDGSGNINIKAGGKLVAKGTQICQN
jgi:type VI secretion system secreted protein VgrG